MNKLGPQIAADMFRWLGRLISVAAVLLISADLASHVGELGSVFTKMNLQERFMLVALAVVCGGMILLWRWELLGASLVVFGMVAFYGLNWSVSGQFPGGPVFPIFFLPAALIFIARLWGGAHWVSHHVSS